MNRRRRMNKRTPPTKRPANPELFIEADIASVCRDCALLPHSISVLVGVDFPWATQAEVLEAVDRMVKARRLVPVHKRYGIRREPPRYTLANP
jgi:hypothetical protein